jgi:hypothetical protein
MLIHVISLTFQSMIEMTIDNQCTNIELISPIYFIKDTTRHGHFPQQVNSESIMRVILKTGIDRNVFGGILLYHLQRKEDDAIDDQADTDVASTRCASISTQLLLIWGRKYDYLYSHLYLIEHESTLTWSRDKLERMYYVYNSQYDVYSDIDQEEWLLNDDTILKTVCEISHGGMGMEVIISEDENQCRLQKPLCIDPNK